MPATLASIQQPVRAELDAVLGELGRIVRSDFPMVQDVSGHLLRMKGKLFRPTLLLLQLAPEQVSGQYLSYVSQNHQP